MERILCISSYEKGQDFMRQCAEMGVKPTLLTVEKLRDAPWPREVLEDVALLPNEYTKEALIKRFAGWRGGAASIAWLRLMNLTWMSRRRFASTRGFRGWASPSTAYYRDKLADAHRGEGVGLSGASRFAVF